MTVDCFGPKRSLAMTDWAANAAALRATPDQIEPFRCNLVGAKLL